MILSRPVLCIVLVLVAFVSGSSAAPPSEKACGPFPDNYREIAQTYAKKAGSFINPKFNPDTMLLRFEAPPRVPDEAQFRKHRGWLVQVQRDFIEKSGGRVSTFPLPFSIIIYRGKVVWGSDEQYGYKP